MAPKVAFPYHGRCLDLLGIVVVPAGVGPAKILQRVDAAGGHSVSAAQRSGAAVRGSLRGWRRWHAGVRLLGAAALAVGTPCGSGPAAAWAYAAVADAAPRQKQQRRHRQAGWLAGWLAGWGRWAGVCFTNIDKEEEYVRLDAGRWLAQGLADAAVV